MKKTVLLLAAILPGLVNLLQAQQFNNNQVAGSLLSNPANIAGTKFSWNLNLFSGNAATGNGSNILSISDLKQLDYRFLKDKLLGNQPSSTAIFTAAINGPSLMFSTRRNAAIAFSTGSRIFATGHQLDGRFASEFNFFQPPTVEHPYQLQPGNTTTVNATAYNQFGITWAGQVLQQRMHTVYAGVSLKYLSGIANTGFQASNLSGTLKYNAVIRDSYLTDAKGTLATRTSGTFFDDLCLASMTGLRKGGIAADFGVNYIFNPLTNFRIPYKLKISFALTDLGKLSFQPDTAYSKTYNVHITPNQSFYLQRNFSEATVTTIAGVFSKSPALFTNTGTTRGRYSMALPAMLRISADYYMGSSFRTQVSANISLHHQGTMNQVSEFSSFSITPGFQRKMLAIYIPVNYHMIYGLHAGAAVQLGPLSFGSRSIITAALGKSKQLDVFAGIGFGQLKSIYRTHSGPVALAVATKRNNLKHEQKRPDFICGYDATLTTTTGNTVPFWMRSNQHGNVPLAGISAGMNGFAKKDYDTTYHKKFNWGAGIQTKVNAGKTTDLILVEAYAKVKAGIFELKGGRCKDIMGFVDTSLSSGSFAVSGNALGVPGIQLSIPQYYSLPLFRKLFALKGNFYHGWMGNMHLVPDTGGAFGRSNISEVKTYLHQKSLYVQVGRPSWKIKFYGGFSHQSQFGNEDLIYYNFNLSKTQGYLYAITGKTWKSPLQATTKLGNQLGTVDLGFSLDLPAVSITAYRQNFYDVGALYYLANIADGLNGISITNKAKPTDRPYWKKILLEVFYSKNQAGEASSKITPSGDEDYYNNYMYTEGWSYKGIGLGNPFITPRSYARADLPSRKDEFFINNRVLAIYTGLQARVSQWDCTAKLSFSRNWGTYGSSALGTSTGRFRFPGTGPYFTAQNQFSGYFEASKSISHGYTLGCLAALDLGSMLYNSTGVQIKISKSFHIK